MKPHFIQTETGEELVVIGRRQYDALLAANGDETAEDRAMGRLTDDYLAEKATGNGADVPFWFVKLVSRHGSPVAAARKHHGCTQVALAQVLDISQGHLRDIERGRRQLTETQLRRIAGHTGIEANWLV